MKNKNFQHYTTQTAFKIDLSKCMVSELLFFDKKERLVLKENEIPAVNDEVRNFISTDKSLYKRGLIKDNYVVKGNDKPRRQGYILTVEGRFVVSLLIRAGFVAPKIRILKHLSGKGYQFDIK